MIDVTEQAVEKAIEDIGGKGTLTHVAKQLGLPVRGPKTEPLKALLQNLVETGRVVLKKATYHFQLSPQLPPEPKTPEQPKKKFLKTTPVKLMNTETIIDCIGALKKDRTYPSTITQLASALGEKNGRELKKHVSGMVRDGILQELKSGRTTKLMLAGDDPRYARPADEALKFELLEENQNLRVEIDTLGTQLAENAQPPAVEEIRPATKDHTGEVTIGDIESRVLDSLRKISKKKKRRGVDIWELRSDLKDLDSDALDGALMVLGTCRKIELQLVQDGTKLTEKQKNGLLILPTGLRIASAALSDE